MLKTEANSTMYENPLESQARKLLEPHGLSLVDRADGIRGHYVIQRLKAGDHWNESKDKWHSVGTIYKDVRRALGQAWLLLETDSPVSAPDDLPHHSGCDCPWCTRPTEPTPDYFSPRP